MKPRLLALALLVVAFVSGGAWWLQRDLEKSLRADIARERERSRELARVRTDNNSRRAAQPAPDKLARLRADHGAVLQLRREVEQLRARIDAREQAQRAR
jgi:hypothetical protein